MKRLIKGKGKGRSRAAPIYELAHGIKVISERRSGKRVYCCLEVHKLFPNTKPNAAGRISVQRSRVVMTAKLGRTLKRSEHVHHKNKKRKHDDRLSNLELLSSADHNKHHKTGTKHKASSKRKIAAGVRKAFKEGRMKRHRWFGPENPFYGRKHTEKAKASMSLTKRKKKRK